MDTPTPPIWKEAPFLRLIMPLTAGIVTAFYQTVNPLCCCCIIAWCIAAAMLFSRFRLSIQFRLSRVPGILLNTSIIAMGALLTTLADTSDRPQRVISAVGPGAVLITRLKEPVVEKPKSYKALASIIAIDNRKTVTNPDTDILLYFRKESGLSPPSLGDEIALSKSPERVIDNPVSPSSGYARYCALQNIYFQAFLRKSDYVTLKKKTAGRFQSLLFSIRSAVVRILQTLIPQKKECGLAEALLIGYKDDLDRQLVQTYSSTGVVHVVAISGLHLGLVFALLQRLCWPLTHLKWGTYLSAIIIIAGLWLFSLLAGGSPSVLRSAVTFSFLVTGNLVKRRGSSWNNLAASAFFLLCYHPFWLIDVGFQLSYAALSGIMLYSKPLFKLFNFKNKLLQAVWNLNAVTLAAQVFTAPLCVYYFHQFPTLFLVSNAIAVPLSGLILMGEIGLCALSPFALVAKPIGWLLYWLLKIMNVSMEYIATRPCALIDDLHIGIVQLLLLYACIAFVSVWLLLQKQSALPAALVAAILFMAVRGI